MDDDGGQKEYIRQVLEAYRKNAGHDGKGSPRGPDAGGTTLSTLRIGEGHRKCIGLAATRRLIRPVDAPPLGTIRSLAYFLPVIEEVLELRVTPDYFQYLRSKLKRIPPTT